MGSKQLGSKFLKRSQICSHTPSALNAGAKRSGATCHMAMPQCCYLAKGAKKPSHTTNTIKFDRIPFDPCNSIKRFDLCPFDQKNSTYLQPPINDDDLCHLRGGKILLVKKYFDRQLCLYLVYISAENYQTTSPERIVG